MSKLEDKTRQLAALHEFLEALAKDPWIESRIATAAMKALKKWDAKDE